MSEQFNLEIVSPEKSFLKKDNVTEVVVPAFEGEMGILKDHIPLITFLRPGLIKIFNESEKKYFVEEGTVEFSNNNLVILSSSITELKTLSKEKISKIIEDTRSQLNEENLDDKKQYVLSHKIDCLTKINL